MLRTQHDLIIGGLDDDWFSGSLSCVRIYNRALTTTEINDWSTCPLGKTNCYHLLISMTISSKYVLDIHFVRSCNNREQINLNLI